MASLGGLPEDAVTPEPAQRSAADFLARLDQDPRAAVRAYRTLRIKLVYFFRRYGFADADELADETILRAFRRFSEGIVLTVPLPAFCYGIARRIVKERAAKSVPAEIENDLPDDYAADPIRRILIVQLLDSLTPEDRSLVVTCYWGDRENLPEDLAITPNALRIRLYRIMRQLRARATGRRTGNAQP
jgi:DNA-directed RNA polymerase specialized sigma24 family protein